MAAAEKIRVSAKNDAAGRLQSRGSEGLVPNPWTASRPTAEAFGLSADDLDEATFTAARRRTEIELRQFPARFISAFLVPLAAFGAAYYFFAGGLRFTAGKLSLAAPPAFEWILYLGASLILAAIGAHMQTRHHAAAKRVRGAHMSAGDRRIALLAAERDWVNEQRRRTTTEFWLNDIKKLAAETNTSHGDVFAREVAKLFAAWGWKVKLDQRSNDHGVDIFAKGKDGSAVIQCIHATDPRPTAAELRELAESRHAFNADFGLMITVDPTATSRPNETSSDNSQLEFWHLGHILEQCMTLHKKRTGEEPPADASRPTFLNPDGTPIMWPADKKKAAE